MVTYCYRLIRDPAGFSYKGKRSIACYYLHARVSLRTILISFIDVNVRECKTFSFHLRAFPHNPKKN